jgi:beta-galactosidase
LRWDDVIYEPGELKVVAYKNGKKWAESRVKTTGEPENLALSADRQIIKADGNDLVFVTVGIADTEGATVPRTHNLLEFNISGPGEIVATDNGDPTDMTSFESTERKAFNGLCLVIVRAKPGKKGKITLTAISAGMKEAQLAIEVR